MVIKEDVPLSLHCTMRLGGNARYFCEVESEADIDEAAAFAKKNKLKIHVLGGGSNTIFTDDGFKGLIVANRIKKFVHETEKGMMTAVVGAGEEWDDVVKKVIKEGFGDISALSLIPGTVGGAPVQNIGAYGQQISDSIVSVRAYNIKKQKWENILRHSCNFSYRTSRFNQQDKGKFIIATIGMRFIRKKVSGPFYKDVQHYFDTHGISARQVSPADLRKAVISIRRLKLPDPAKVANTGSFFKNPKVSSETYHNLLKHYPDLKSHKTDDGNLKLYAGQLIELAGMKNYHDKKTGISTWKNQALVLVNEEAKTTADLLEFKNKVIMSVHAAFGITLQQEPELIGK